MGHVYNTGSHPNKCFNTERLSSLDLSHLGRLIVCKHLRLSARFPSCHLQRSWRTCNHQRRRPPPLNRKRSPWFKFFLFLRSRLFKKSEPTQVNVMWMLQTHIRGERHGVSRFLRVKGPEKGRARKEMLQVYGEKKLYELDHADKD